jgi:hypothetical protein
MPADRGISDFNIAALNNFCIFTSMFLKLHKFNVVLAITALFLLLAISCKKNIPPAIHFIQPESNIAVNHDTILTFIVEATDEDDGIACVVFYVNNTKVCAIFSPPYQYEWHASVASTGTFIIKAVAFDNKNAEGNAEIQVYVSDYRQKYYGDFYFKTITEWWMLGQPTTYDTTYYQGIIRKYETADSENDLYLDDDSDDNPNEKITILFKQNTKITSLLTIDGQLVPKTGYHYGHHGGFTHIDTIDFYVGGLGGLGGGNNYFVTGVRE